MTTTAVQTRTESGGANLTTMLNNALPELQKIAPRYVNVTRMVALAVEAKMRNRLLEHCSPVSVLNFCKKCAEAGTDRVGAGGMWAVPFYNSKTRTFDMTPIPDWRLIVEKCKKAKAITHAIAEAVYENDVFEYERGLNPVLRHVPARKDRGELTDVYCVYTLPDGSKDFVVMNWADDIVPIRDRTNAWKAWLEKHASNPWVTDPAEQAKKTVVKRALKPFEGASIELTQIIELDNVVNGYADRDIVNERPAIAMPRELPTETSPPADETAGASPTADPPPQAHPPTASDPADGGASPSAPLDQDGDTITGIIEQVSSKAGKKKDGTPYTRYGVKIGDTWYGTFSETLANEAAIAKEQDLTVHASVEKKGKWWNLTGLDVAEDKAASGQDQRMSGTKTAEGEDGKAPASDTDPEPPMREPGADEDEHGQEDLPL